MTTCPHCGAAIDHPESAGGTCPSCGRSLAEPGPNDADPGLSPRVAGLVLMVIGMLLIGVCVLFPVLTAGANGGRAVVNLKLSLLGWLFLTCGLAATVLGRRVLGLVPDPHEALNLKSACALFGLLGVTALGWWILRQTLDALGFVQIR